MKNFVFSRFVILGVCVLPLLQGCIAAVGTAAATSGVIIAQERSPGRAVDDTAIWGQIKHAYLQKDAQDLLAGVNVEVIDARVHLTGTVKNTQTRIDAVRLAWQVDGVKEVINEIQIQEQTNLKNIMQDKWIITQLDSRLLTTKGIKSLNYSTEVVNGQVYLMGIAQNREELDKVTDIARKIKGVKKVISHVRIKDI